MLIQLALAAATVFGYVNSYHPLGYKVKLALFIISLLINGIPLVLQSYLSIQEMFSVHYGIPKYVLHKSLESILGSHYPKALIPDLKDFPLIRKIKLLIGYCDPFSYKLQRPTSSTVITFSNKLVEDNLTKGTQTLEVGKSFVNVNPEIEVHDFNDNNNNNIKNGHKKMYTMKCRDAVIEIRNSKKGMKVGVWVHGLKTEDLLINIKWLVDNLSGADGILFPSLSNMILKYCPNIGVHRKDNLNRFDPELLYGIKGRDELIIDEYYELTRRYFEGIINDKGEIPNGYYFCTNDRFKYNGYHCLSFKEILIELFDLKVESRNIIEDACSFGHKGILGELCLDKITRLSILNFGGEDYIKYKSIALSGLLYVKKPDGVKNCKWKYFLSDINRLIDHFEGVGSKPRIAKVTKMGKGEHFDNILKENESVFEVPNFENLLEDVKVDLVSDNELKSMEEEYKATAILDPSKTNTIKVFSRREEEVVKVNLSYLTFGKSLCHGIENYNEKGRILDRYKRSFITKDVGEQETKYLEENGIKASKGSVKWFRQMAIGRAESSLEEVIEVKVNFKLETNRIMVESEKTVLKNENGFRMMKIDISKKINENYNVKDFLDKFPDDVKLPKELSKKYSHIVNKCFKYNMNRARRNSNLNLLSKGFKEDKTCNHIPILRNVDKDKAVLLSKFADFIYKKVIEKKANRVSKTERWVLLRNLKRPLGELSQMTGYSGNFCRTAIFRMLIGAGIFVHNLLRVNKKLKTSRKSSGVDFHSGAQYYGNMVYYD